MPHHWERFEKLVQRIHTLASVSSVLGWDQETQMPTKGATARGEHSALIAGIAHEAVTSTEMADCIAALRDTDDLSDAQQTILRETAREHDRAVKVPQSLVEELSRVRVLATEAWRVAREGDDFAHFAPHLTRIVSLKCDEADHVGYASHRYDALLDEYEPGATCASVTAMFAPFRGEARALLDAVLSSAATPPTSILRRPLSVDAQRAFCREAAADLGFDFDAGRLDVSAHPFCSGFHPRDVRLTTRYDENDPLSSFFGTLHETGHGLYEQGLSTEHAFTPMGAAVSLGVHESQSRLWENLVGRSRPFWSRYLPKLRTCYGGQFDDVSLDDMLFAANAVTPSLIRVEADELTYNFHILLRFELEAALIGGDVPIGDLPDAWRQGMETYVGIAPEDDADGVLQDVHWSHGLFGYFPTYTLGNLYAAQLFAAIRRDVDDVDGRVANGEFGAILDWLRTRIHGHGMRYGAAQLIERATGEEPTAEYLIAYLREKLTPLYDL
jgi:carboxypeptidase Taq